ncbi:MAG TPA: hypothetical protein VF765_20140 [Polyangiaceae bacterium]
MSADRIRILLEDILREHVTSGGGRGLFEQARDRAQRAGITIDNDFYRTLTDHFWTLARAGIIAIMPRDIPVVPGVVPMEERQHGTFYITDLGKKVLSEPSITPYDWDRYQQTVKLKLTGAPDRVVLVHLGEAVRAWQSGIYRSSAVMLGCAVEQLILLLAAALRDAKLTHSPAPKLDGMLRKVTPITDLYDVVHKVLENLVADKALTGDIADVWDQRLTAGFHHTRILRNKSGHPTDAVVTPDDAYSGLLLFPGLYEFIERLILKLPPPPAAAAAPPGAPPPAPVSPAATS